MKFKNALGRIVIFTSIFIISALSFFCASAVGEEGDTAAEAAPPAAVETEPAATQPVATEPPTDPPTDPPTQAPTQAVTERVTEAYVPTQSQTAYMAPETEKATYATQKPNAASLPMAETEPDPTAVVIAQGDNGDLTYGFVSWACVIVGVLAVVIVIISNKSHYNGGEGKHRYNEGNKITGQKRLLNDDYYNNRKYASYYDKDTRQ